MLTDRIFAVFAFRKGVYAEAEKDTSFTTTAWILVAVAAFLNQLGSFASPDLIGWLIGAIGGTVFAILGFVVGALVIAWAGRILFKAEVSFGELVRVLGLAYVWQAVGVLGIVTAFSDALSSELYMVKIFAITMMVVAWVVAAKEALDLGWLQTGVTIILGWLAQFVITTIITGLVLGLLGLGVAALG
ncbi:MAG: hypothetical protein PVF47_19795 [Anaerolineae bacterium]|jgi:hypothetical protein